MSLPTALLNVERTWVRRVLLLLYVLPGIAFNVLLWGPMNTVVQAYHYSLITWRKRP